MLTFPSARHPPQGLSELWKSTIFFGGKKLNSLTFLKSPKSSALLGMTSFASLVPIPIWGFYFDICEWHILPVLMLHLTNPCAKQKVLSLTKPKGKIYKMKSLGYYITYILFCWIELSIFTVVLKSVLFYNRQYLILTRSLQPKHYHQMQFNVIPKTPFLRGRGLAPLQGGYSQYILRPGNRALCNCYAFHIKYSLYMQVGFTVYQNLIRLFYAEISIRMSLKNIFPLSF